MKVLKKIIIATAIIGMAIAITSCTKEEMEIPEVCTTIGVNYQGKFYPKGEGCNTSSFIVNKWWIHDNDDCKGNGAVFAPAKGTFTLEQECK